MEKAIIRESNRLKNMKFEKPNLSGAIDIILEDYSKIIKAYFSKNLVVDALCHQQIYKKIELLKKNFEVK